MAWLIPVIPVIVVGGFIFSAYIFLTLIFMFWNDGESL